MTTPEDLERAAQQLREQRDLIGKAGARAAQVSGSATSRDRMITATVDGQGQLTGLKLTGTRWQKMASADLCARIVETVRTAQQEASGKSMAAFMEFVPDSLGGVLDGTFDLDEMLCQALRKGSEELFPGMRLGRGPEGERG